VYLTELLKKLEEIREEHGGHLIVDVFTPTWHRIHTIKVALDPQMGLDSLIINTKPAKT
jgi:hypothetical protein